MLCNTFRQVSGDCKICINGIIFVENIFGWKDLVGFVFAKIGCRHANHCQCKMKTHQKGLASAFKHFENVKEVTSDPFSYPAYLLDEICGNTAFLLFI